MPRFLLPLLLSLLLLPLPAHANDASVGRIGETIRPIQDTQIQMMAEEVRVHVTRERTYVEATFTFRNTEFATTVLMGFPEHQLEDEGFPGDPHLRDFRTWVDGVSTPAKREPGLVPKVTGSDDSGSLLRERDFPAWHTWEVPFAAGQTREVRNTYWCHPTFRSNGEVGTGYILVTGATWYGKIDRATVTFEFDGILPYQLSTVSPGDYRFEGTSLVWEWTDFEPVEDIRLVIDARGMLAVAHGYLPEQAGELEDLCRQGDYAALLAWVRALQTRATPEQGPTLLLYEARAHQGLGRTAEAVQAWERLLEMAPRAGETAQEYLVAADARAEIFYYLVTQAHAAGDRNRLEKLYRQIREARASLVVQRWVETLLPAASISRSAPLGAAEIRPDPHSGHWWLHVEAEDPDADMVSIRAVAWLVTDGDRVMAIDEQTPVGQDTYRTSHAYYLGEIPPGAQVEYWVEVSDTEGLGTVVSTAEEAEEAAEPAPRSWLLNLVAAAMLVLGSAWVLRRRQAG
ncbi:MAG: hypothetical protein RDU89_08940 [bacterium]|nr:hypothetical protein [bacterium]